MKKKLLKIVLMTSLCAMLLSTTGCGVKELFTTNTDDSKIENSEETTAEEDEEESTEVDESGKYTSSDKVIMAFWESMKNEDRDLMTSCFYEKATQAEEYIDKNMEISEKIYEYTVMYLDDLAIEDSEDIDTAEDVLTELGYKDYSDFNRNTVTVPMTQTVENTDYDVHDIYDIITVCIEDNWYIVKIDEIDVVVIDSREDVAPANTNENSKNDFEDKNTKEPIINEKEDDNTDAVNDQSNIDLPNSYVSKEDRSFKVNGKVYTLGKTTLQELIDDGVIFEDLSNANNNIKPNYTSEKFDIVLNAEDYYNCSIRVGNFTDENAVISDCPIVSINIYNNEYSTFVENSIEFSFPLTLTEEELIANAGEPTEISEYNLDNNDYQSRTLSYKWEGSKYIGSSGYSFDFVNGVLYYVNINFEP